ncbi:MAG: M3 family oligoendopeptidase [Promethearchaeota archaeon]|nr:MAG: M3 family oligoendopeptidase [Candidatus Lokiarchaeota archaeon]
MTQEIIKWNLSDYYSDINDPQIEKDIQNIEKSAELFYQNVKGNLGDPSLTPIKLLEWYKEYEEISEKVFYLDTYSTLLYRINTLDDDVKSFYAKIDEFKVKIQEKLLFFDLELNQISDSKFEELINASDLKNYSHALKFNRIKKPHQLSEKEEQIILMKDITGTNGFLKLYSELKSSFLFDFEVEGEMKKLTEAELFSYMYQENKDLRYRALQTMMSEYKNNEMIFTHILNNILKDWDLECKKKNYSQPISRRNVQNEVSDESVEILGKVTTESYHIVEKYYNLKKKLLNLPELHMSDIYAPVGQITRKYSYQEALELIKGTVAKFYPELKNIVEKLVELGHIDATPRKGKNRGAFCAHGKQKNYGFVFVNYVDTIDSLRALAHELGHAFHAYYIQRDQNFINIDISLVVAEIASVFNEILTFDYLMSTDLSREEKISLLSNFIESKFGTSHRQNAFYRFEKTIHALIEKKLPSTEEIKQAFVNEMELMFGNSITKIKEEYENYVFVVPHFLSVPFYVYAYNMSNLLVISIYQLYLEEKEKFVPKYLKLLSIGSSLSPEEMLSEIGINLDDPSFWEKGIKYLSDKIDELEKLVKEL